MNLHRDKHTKELAVDVGSPAVIHVTDSASDKFLPGSTNESAVKREHIRGTLS